MNKEKLTLLNYTELVPADEQESVKLALSELNQTIFPYVLSVLYDKEKGYDIIWEPEKDGKEPDYIAEEMTVDEFLVAQYVLCTSFETFAEKNSHASLDRKYLDAIAAVNDNVDEKTIVDANGIKIVKQMPCVFMNQNSHGRFIEFDRGTVIGFTNEFVMIEPLDHEKYRNYKTKEYRIIYRKPSRLICGNIIDPFKKSPCQERAEREAREKAYEKLKNGEQITEDEQKLIDEWEAQQKAVETVEENKK